MSIKRFWKSRSALAYLLYTTIFLLIFELSSIPVSSQPEQSKENDADEMKKEREGLRRKFIEINGIVDVRHSKFWGPGLVPSVLVLPARYFYVKLMGYGGMTLSLNESLTVGDDLKVRVDCNGDRIVWTQILDRKDGTFIVRYKLFQSCVKGLRIIVTFDNMHLPNSPIIFGGPVHPDACDCPSYEAGMWLKRAKCPKKYDQIENDLKPFTHEIDFDDVFQNAMDNLYEPGTRSFCHYTIKDNQIYRKCYGHHVGFHIFPDSILLSLARKMYLPDMEFLMNLGDWPLVDKRKFKIGPIPLFSWCKSNETMDILLPTYELTEASLESMARLRVTLDMMTVQSNSEKIWKDKIPQLFWRGRDSREERLDLILIGRNHPELFNVSITNYFFYKDKEPIFGKSDRISFFKFFDYKYQLNIDGTVAAYRFPFLLGGDSLVFKTNSKYIEHFYEQIQPWTHYVPIKADLSDLPDKVNWAIKHDAEAQEIAQNGRTFAQENLMPLNIFCYHVSLYREWAKRLTRPIRIRPEFEKVPQPELSKGTICQCNPRPRDYNNGDGDDKDEL